jgi:hypothetical protein
MTEGRKVLSTWSKNGTLTEDQKKIKEVNLSVYCFDNQIAIIQTLR